MADFYASYPPNVNANSAVPTYANLAAFPSAISVGNGALAIALDTDTLYVSNGTVWEAIASPSAVLSVGAIDGQAPVANGLQIVSNALYAQSADATHPGMINNSTQTFAGVKTFSANPIMSGLTASQAVVTDGSKQLTSLGYATASTPSTLVERDVSSNINIANANISALTASQAVVTDASKNLASLAYATTATANTLAERDANGNLSAVNMISNSTFVTSTGGTTNLTPANARVQILTGTLTQTFQLPNANTFAAPGATYEFNNNSTGVLTVQDFTGGAVCTIPSGGYARVILTAQGSSAGTWDKHFLIPANGSYGTAGQTVTGTFAATSTVQGTQLISTVATGTSPLSVTSTTKVTNLYVDRSALADTVTTNANLTGVITSVGNATSTGAQTGTGSTFVMQNTPTLTTPNIGAATGTSLSVTGQLTSTVATGTAPLAVSSTTKVANLYVDRSALADTVTTNANLTGVITSVGNATSIASQTGTGTKFVVDTGPTISNLVMTGIPNAQSNLYMGTTAAATGLAAGAYQYLGNKKGELLLADSNTFGDTYLMGGAYWNGTNFAYSTLNANGGYVAIHSATSASSTLIDFIGFTSVSHAADATASATPFGSVNGNGLWTLGASGGTQQHVVNGQINLTGGQVQFPVSQNASANANTLDDYAESNPNTVTLTASTSGSPGAYTTRFDSYVKIGKVVFCSIRLVVPIGTLSGNLSIGNLKYTQENITNSSVSVTISEFALGGATNVVSLLGYMAPNTNTINLYKQTSITNANDITTLTAADCSGTVVLALSLQYFAPT